MNNTDHSSKFKLKYFDRKAKTVDETVTKKQNRKKKKPDNFFLQLMWVTPAFIFIGLFTFFAVFILFKNGFNGALNFLTDWEFTTEAFKITVNDPTFQIALRNSLMFVGIALPIEMMLSIAVAKAISTILNKRMFSFLQGVFFLPYVTSAMAVAMTFSFIFSNSQSGFFNQILGWFGIDPIAWTLDKDYAIWLVLIYGVWRALPFNIVMLTASFMRISPQYYAAASADGMPKWKQFWRVTMPQATPMIIYLVTIGIISSFKVLPLGLFGSELAAEAVNAQTVVFWIYEKTTGASSNSVSYQMAGAGSIILLGIILAITIVSRIITNKLSKRYQ